MKHFLFFVMTIFSFNLLLSQEKQDRLVISNVHVIPISSDKLLKNQDVIIENGLITDIKPHHKKNKYKGFQIIEGNEQYLMPGLSDMHTHLPDVTHEFTYQDFYHFYLANGITHLRSMQGRPNHPAHRDSISNGLIKAPNLYISLPLPDKDSLAMKLELFKFLKTYKEGKYNFVKYLNGLSKPTMENLVKLFAPRKIILAGHVYNDLETTVDLGFRSIEHMSPIVNSIFTDSIAFAKTAKKMKEKEIFFCPTISYFKIGGFQYSGEELKNRYGMDKIDTSLIRSWENMYISLANPKKLLKANIYNKQKKAVADEFLLLSKAMKILKENGVDILIGPDAIFYNVPGYSVLHEMEEMKTFGYSNYEILRMATYNAAKFYHEENKWGTIEKGMEANLILLQKNPIDELNGLHSVNLTMVKGKVLYQNP